MPPMFFRSKSEKVKIAAGLCKMFGSNAGKPFYWLVGLNKFSKRESMPLDSRGAFVKTAVKQ